MSGSHRDHPTYLSERNPLVDVLKLCNLSFKFSVNCLYICSLVLKRKEPLMGTRLSLTRIFLSFVEAIMIYFAVRPWQVHSFSTIIRTVAEGSRLQKISQDKLRAKFYKLKTSTKGFWRDWVFNTSEDCGCFEILTLYIKFLLPLCANS